jgi:CxxC motif-containing protein (DUF1111 family)
MTQRFHWAPLRRVAIVSAAVLVITIAFSLIKPSPRVVKASDAKAPTLGDPIPKLTSVEQQMFSQGNIVYIKTWDPRQGLGPIYTQDNCTNCHGSPIAGGGGGSLNNIDTIFATVDSTGQFDPMDGSDPNDPTYPIGEGGVLQQPQSISAFVPTCKYNGEVIPTTPPFTVAATLFEGRLAPPNFGMGLIDSIPAIQITNQAMSEQRNGVVFGQVNSVPDEYGTITDGKFGFKAQYATLTQFIGQAMTLEIGITNPVNPTEQLSNGVPIPKACLNGDKTEPNDPNGTSMIDIFHYLLYLAPNQAAACTSNACLDGQTQFSAVGCNNCHLTPSEGYTTGNRIEVPETYSKTGGPCDNGVKCLQSKALSNQPVPLYSDLLLHDMGAGTSQSHLGDGFCSPQPVLAGDCPFGQADGTQFRTTPLWGLSLRTLYLHDGRTNSLTTAIQDHAINGTGEAANIVAAFNGLTTQEQSDLITFLNTL